MRDTAGSRPSRPLVALAVVAAVAAGTAAVAVAHRPADAREVLPAASATASPGAVGVPAATAEEIDQHVELRRIFAMRNDRAYVEAVQVADDTTVNAWLQLPVTPEEAAELARQDTLQPKTEQMSAVLAESGSFGGTWVENPVGERQVMVVAYVGELAPAVEQQLLDIAGSDPLRLTPVARSEQTLLRIMEEVATTPAGLAGSLTGWGIDIMANRVNVSVDPGAPARTEADLVARFGDVFTFTRQGPAVAAQGD